VRACLIDPLGPCWRRLLHAPPERVREVDVHLGAGDIAFRDWPIVRRIRARDVIGASTARTPRGVALSLVTRGRGGRPITLEVANDAEAAEIRHALGIGHHGFGKIGMPTDWVVASNTELVARTLTTIGVVVIALGVGYELWTGDEDAALAILFATSFYLVAPFVALWAITLGRRLGGAGLLLTDDGVRIRRARGPDVIDYAKIREVYADGRGVRLAMTRGGDVAVPAVAGRWVRERPSVEEIEIVAAQIHSAVQRARGAGDSAPSLPLRVADLAKTEDDALAWLSRLDATAASLAGDGGYRGAAFDEADLWKTVDSADAPPEVRAAAARILVRAAGERARTKLDEILPRVRVVEDERRIRIALDDDTERAAEAWTNFEKHERRRAS
jgi:hypothetical protein